MDIICFSHLRWNFVYQRPQHLMSRFARNFRVFFFEEPVFDGSPSPTSEIATVENVHVITPHIPENYSSKSKLEENKNVLKNVIDSFEIDKWIAWFYTPMAFPLIEEIKKPEVLIYDCMDELSAFKNAPDGIKSQEESLMKAANIVFTGGHSLYKAKQHLHSCIFPFPSSIDKEHFARARSIFVDPADQAEIPYPRIGFFGVLDERLDIELLDRAASLRPDYHFILLGPVVKIDPETLPKHSNIHYLGNKSYVELPAYLSGWDVAMIPFARNESTRFISPTKTPEYLAGGIPVVSTPIADVIHPYGSEGLVFITATPEGFIQGIEWGMRTKEDKDWLRATDHFLRDLSWDITWEKMMFHVNMKLEEKQSTTLTTKNDFYV